MTARCSKCKRPMKTASESGLGPTCLRRSKVQPVPAYERDLLGYELDEAERAARYRVRVQIETAAAQAYIAVRDGFRRARVELLGWEAR